MISVVDASKKLRQNLITEIDDCLKSNLYFACRLPAHNASVMGIFNDLSKDYESMGWIVQTTSKNSKPYLEIYTGEVCYDSQQSIDS
jgi:hypothetical protein